MKSVSMGKEWPAVEEATHSDGWRHRIRWVALWCWGLMALSLPFSTALTLVFSVFGTLFGLIGFHWRSMRLVLRHPITLISLALFAWLAVSGFWSVAPHDELMEGISKYRKLLFIPLIAMLLVAVRARSWYLMYFFLVGCLVVTIGSLSSSTNFLGSVLGPQLPQGGWGLGGSPEKYWFYIGPPNMPTFGRAYIAQGAFLVMAIMFAVGHLIRPTSISLKLSSKRALLWTTIGFFMTLVVANLGGRTGYLLLVIGLTLWAYVIIRWISFKAALNFIALGLLLVVLAMSLGGSASKVLERVGGAIADVEQFNESGAQTSQGLRLRFWLAGLDYGRERPVTGWGVGSYAEVFSRDGAQPLNLRDSRPHPHSEYVLQLVQGGGVALCIFVALGLLLLRLLLRATRPTWDPTDTGPEIAVLISSMVLFVDAFFNSVVWDLGEGHALSIVLAMVVASAVSERTESR